MNFSPKGAMVSLIKHVRTIFCNSPIAMGMFLVHKDSIQDDLKPQRAGDSLPHDTTRVHWVKPHMREGTAPLASQWRALLLLTCSLWDSSFWNIKKSQKSKTVPKSQFFSIHKTDATACDYSLVFWDPKERRGYVRTPLKKETFQVRTSAMDLQL